MSSALATVAPVLQFTVITNIVLIWRARKGVPTVGKCGTKIAKRKRDYFGLIPVIQRED